jgi:hypothetical protein
MKKSNKQTKNVVFLKGLMYAAGMTNTDQSPLPAHPLIPLKNIAKMKTNTYLLKVFFLSFTTVLRSG